MNRIEYHRRVRSCARASVQSTPAFFLSNYLLHSYLRITTGSANLEILIK